MHINHFVGTTPFIENDQVKLLDLGGPFSMTTLTCILYWELRNMKG